MIEIKNLRKSYGNRILFEELNLYLAKGEIVSILGPSGCGKSTLLRICCGLEVPDEGVRVLNGTAIEDGQIVPEIAMLFQQPVPLYV